MPSGLIIGITGFTGGALARRLAAAGWDVRGIDEHEDAAPELDELGISIELADVGDPDELEALGQDGDHVFYVMRSVSDSKEDMERRTIRGVMNVVDALRGTEIASFVYGSTMGRIWPRVAGHADGNVAAPTEYRAGPTQCRNGAIPARAARD